MDHEEMERVVISLASTLELTRIELDALRVLFKGVLSAIAENPGQLPTLPAALRAAIAEDEARSLNTLMPDEMLQKRTEMQRVLMPLHLRQSVLPDS